MFSNSSVAEPKGDNAGGMGASVIVVLLLIATLLGLLFYYLQTREKAEAMNAQLSSSPPPSAGPGFSNEAYEPVSYSNIQTFANTEP